jgi:hypothetical protein
VIKRWRLIILHLKYLVSIAVTLILHATIAGLGIINDGRILKKVALFL